MKKLLSNKKFLMGAIGVMVGISILMAGLSYAWFTSSGSSDSKTVVTLGNLEIKTDLIDGGNTINLFDEWYQGNVGTYNGLNYLRAQTAWVKNTGDLNAFMKLTFDVTVNGAPASLVPDDFKVVLLRNDGFSAVFPEQNHECQLNGEWYFKKIGEGNYEYYAYIDAGDDYQFEYAIVFDMGNIDNDYNGATIEVGVKAAATNNIDEAIATVFFAGNLDWEDGLTTFQSDLMDLFGGGSLIHPMSGGLGW